MKSPSTEAEAAAGFVLASIHMLSPPLLAQLAQSAIDRLDQIDGDCDLEDGLDAEDICEDLEYDFRDQPAFTYGPDQTDLAMAPEWLARCRSEMFGQGPIRG